jgi:phosphocarrier protein|tara:strand:- start:260 stop:550 length:291 start_codon:yes stop_codon:yes gene_type:complete
MESKTNGNVAMCELVVENQSGLHARPAAAFVKTANSFRAEIIVTKDGDSVNGKSIMGLMTLAAARGAKLIIEANGDDAIEAVSAIQSLAEDSFNEA